MNKKNLTMAVFMLSVALFWGTTFGQLGIGKGIKLGYNWAKLTNDLLSTTQTKKALTGGVSLEFNILNIVSLQTDVLYSPRGSLIKNDSTITLKYISIPVILKRKFFPVGIHPYLLIGPEINFLFSADIDGMDIKNLLNTEDFAVVTGAGIEFSLLGKGVYIEARYSYGLNGIYKDQSFSSSKNRVYQIFGGFMF